MRTHFPTASMTAVNSPAFYGVSQPYTASAVVSAVPKNAEVPAITDTVTLSPQGLEAYRKIQKVERETPYTATAYTAGTYLNSLANLGKLIGLEADAARDAPTFIKKLEKNIAEESESLTALLKKAFTKAGLGEITKKVSFFQDAEGNIVVEGNIRADWKEDLAKQINADSEFAERIKTQRAKMDILAELKSAAQDEPDFSKDELAPARQQLLKNYLTKNNISLNELSTKPDEETSVLILRDAKGNEKSNSALETLLNELPGLEGELKHYLETKPEPQAELRPLLSMKRGVLSEASEESDFNDSIRGVQGAVGKLMKQYNEELAFFDENLQITDFIITLNHQGRATIDVKTKSGNAEDTLRAKRFMNSQFPSSATEELGQAILEAHDDKHGDIVEFQHKVVISRGKIGEYTIQRSKTSA